MSDSDLNLQPIGFIRSCYKQRFGTPRQSGLVPAAQGVIELQPFLQPEFSFVGIEGFSHLWLIFGFHKNTNKEFHTKICPPRSPDQRVGVYASRSPHRWNPLGLSLVKFDKIEGRNLFVSGVDIIDGSPIYDIKPYVVEVESVPEAKNGWLDRAENLRRDVVFADDVEANLSVEFRNLVVQTLSHDPRPQSYKVASNRDEKEFIVDLNGRQVYFHCLDNGQIKVISVVD